jgi:prepilin signal peptidase PulO-like enzyme (type II secretory pathway)
MAILIISMFGLIMGSFISALVWRLHEQLTSKSKARAKARSGELSIVHGRSLCPQCRHQLGARDLIPLLSWLWQRGKCRYCRAAISVSYPILELLTASLFGLIAYYIGFATTITTLESVLWLGASIGLVTLALYDGQWKILPNQIVLPLIGWAVALRVLQAVLLGETAGLTDSLIGGLALFSTFAIVFYASRGTWLGGGDVKLAAFMGIVLGWQLGFLALMLAAWIGTAVVLVRALQNGLRLDRRQQIPFGPLLIIGTYLSLFYGQVMIDWYQSTLVV